MAVKGHSLGHGDGVGAGNRAGDTQELLLVRQRAVIVVLYVQWSRVGQGRVLWMVFPVVLCLSCWLGIPGKCTALHINLSADLQNLSELVCRAKLVLRPQGFPALCLATHLGNRSNVPT